MKDNLPPYVSMVDVLEADYNANYEEWKRRRDMVYAIQKARFYDDNMTNHTPVTVGHIIYKAYAPRESDVIRFLITALAVIAVIFWLIPAIYYHGNAAKMNEIGTLTVLEDMMNERELNGVYVKENGKWREAEQYEIDCYMETSETGN